MRITLRLTTYEPIKIKIMERTKLATELVSVHVFVYDKNTQILIQDFFVDYKFPKSWSFGMRLRKMKEICGNVGCKYPTREFKFKLPE